MKHIPVGPVTTSGYDVSHYQNNYHLHEQMKIAGKKFCIIKSDEGATIIDDRFKAHYAEAKKQGMIVGFYNYFHPAQDAHKQAQHMLKLIGPLQNDLGGMCDFETMDKQVAGISRERAFEFTSEVEKALNRVGLFYTGPYFWRDTAKGETDTRFARFKSVIAHYGVKPSVGPLVPLPWTKLDFWQYTETGGIDLDLFNGSLDELTLLTKPLV